MSRPKADTLYHVLKYRAETQPNDPAYVYLINGEEESHPLTYKELQEASKQLAGRLQALNMHGERALLIFESDYNYIISFFACIYAGVISVPLHPPGKNKSMSRISAIANDSGAKLILSTREIFDELKHESENDEVLRPLKWILTDEEDTGPDKDWEEPKLTPDSITYLQYTSGSTGIPKGVIVSHGNLITNLTIIDKSHPHDDKSVMVTWLPIHHDMGLIYGMLLPFFCGYPCYFMTPQAFVQRPYRWLHAISKYRGTHNAAPNFAFELCANKIGAEEKKNLDLSTWTVAMNAAEPVRAETLRRFTESFSECGFRFENFKPGYGLAEGTLILSTTFKDRTAKMARFDDEQLERHNRAVESTTDDTTSKVHVGHCNSIEDTRIAIVNPGTLLECGEGEVGEVWAKGRSIAQGYWQREDATEETFRAKIADTGEGPFLRTGDLGFIKDNELYITGRHKDLIIIRGQNHYPQDIEYTVEASHPALRLGCVAAFPVDDNGEEKIGIVQEVQKNRENDLDADEIFKAIRTAVSKEHDLQISSITLIKAQTIPKTSSGKIQRRACKEGFLGNTLATVAEWKQSDAGIAESAEGISESKDVSFEAIREFITGRLSQMLNLRHESIDASEAFSAYGMDSLKAVQISGELEEFLGRELPATLVYDYPTVNALSEFLSGKRSAGDRVVGMKPRTDKQPVAITGIGLRFPGGCNDPQSFYKFLLNGGDAIREVPEGRWPESQMKGNTVRLGGFIDDVDKFDPAFWGISPREALQIDPQQRLALEVAWEALEDACIDPSKLAGTNTGVFMGVCSYDYSRFTSGRKEHFDVYTGTGTSLSIVANRISYLLDLRGPSLAIDTACSSSLVALHTACRSLNEGDCSTALAGGVNLLLSPDWNVVFTEADMLAPDGHCKTFDASADGYVRSEGCAVVVLKRLADAINDGDRIYAVISGSAINQDGKSNGLTAPNGPSQVDVIRRALHDAGITADEIGYVEAHGTGTPLGDPIEVNSITEALNAASRKSAPLRIGSVKTNIGHLEAAAGIAGVIKTALGFHYGSIPRQINYTKLNSEILLNDLPVRVATDDTHTEGKIRYAGISSFGFGGTNAHVILSPAPDPISVQKKPSRPESVVTLSAASESALDRLASEYVRFMELNPGVSLDDISYSANTGREAMSHRLAVTGSTSEDILRALRRHADSESLTNAVKGIAKPGKSPKTVFLFPGQGAQYTGMGKELYDTVPSFRDDINKCNEILKSYLPISLLEVLFDESEASSGALDRTRYTQPALFAIEYALGRLWMSWGIVPAVMMGHSAGEYVAACLAGVFSLEDGLKLVAERGRLMEEMTGDGEMYTVFADTASTRKMLEGFEDRVSIGSINSPVKTVISGDAEAVRKIVEKLDREQIEYRKINVSIASHSPMMKPMIDEFRKVCQSVKYIKATIPVVSNMTAEITNDRIAKADYWCEHILSPVDFSGSIKACSASGCTHFIDLGPKPTSLSMAQETLTSAELAWIPSFKKNFTSWQTLNEGLARLFADGAEINWNGYHSEYSGAKISLPHYPFQRQSYWIADRVAEGGVSFGDGIPSGSVLLGSRANTSSKKFSIFNSRISANEPSYLSGHKVFGKTVFPGAGFAELMLAAASEAFGDSGIKLESLKFHEALFFDEDKPVSIQTIFTQTDKGKGEIGISSLNASGSWTLHATAKARSVSGVKSKKSPVKTETGKGKSIDTNEFYLTARSEGIDYTGAFENIKSIRIEKHVVNATAVLKEGEGADGYHLHPALLDMAFQAALAGLLRERKAVYVPSSIAGITFHRIPSGEITVTAESLAGASKPGAGLYDINITDADGTLCAEVRKLRLTEVSRENFPGMEDGKSDMFYKIVWKQSPESKVKKLTFDPHKAVPAGKDIEKVLKHTADFKSLLAYADSVHKLDEITAYFILDAIRSSGIAVNSGSKYGIDELKVKTGVSPKHEKLFTRLLEILEEKELAVVSDGMVSFSEDAVAVLENAPGMNDTAGDDPARHERAFVIQCGRRLNEVFTERADALEVLFPGGDFTAAGNIYRHSPGFEVMNRIISKTLSNIQRSLISGRKLRVLELGAGTGSTSIYALKDLRPSKTEYVFTDISPSFFEKARELLKDRSDVEFKTLDIEKDPASQGFADESFDVIIASNVIHAVRDLKESIAHIRRLLRKGGTLILNEATEKRAWIDLTFGMTEGWWRFADNVRQGHPLLTVQQWKKVIENSGFENFTSLAHEDEEGNVCSGQNVIVAQRDNVNAEQRRRVNVIISDGVQHTRPAEEIAGVFGETVTAEDSEVFARISDTEFTTQLSSPEGVKELFDEDAIVGAGSLCVVYIAGNRNTGIGEETYEEALRTSSALLNITKCMKETGVPAELRVITRNAIGAADGDSFEGLYASPLWGMCKVIDLEHPELRTRIADTDDETDKAFVLHEMLSEDSEKFTAFRNGKKMEARIEKSAPAGRHNFYPKKNFAYLVTGGFSGIGLLTARMLADLGAKNIILAGRRGTSPEAETLKRELAERRVRVFTVKADVSKPEDIEDIFDIAEEGGVKIKGIIHSAGLLDDAVVMNQSAEKFRNVFGPKVKSALMIYDRTKKSGLQFFVMYSSIAAVLGSAGQSNHSAANAFLDSLSRYIQSKGLNSMSINWGVWSEIGSAAERGADRQEKISGIETISPGEGIDALRKVFDSNVPQLGVFKVNWSKYNAAVSNSLTCELTTEESGDGTSSVKKSAKESLAEKLSHTEVKDQSALLQDYFRNLISSIMGLEPEDIEPDIPLSSMGLDSLMAIELKNRVNLELGVNLNLVRYMEETDINRLSEELKEQIPALMSKSGLSTPKEEAAPKAPTESDKARDLLANLDELSEEELDKLLKEMN